MMLTEFGRRLRELRRERDLAVCDMAEELGRTPTYILFIEYGLLPVTSIFFDDLIRTYSIPEEELKAWRHDAAYNLREQYPWTLDEVIEHPEEYKISAEEAKQIERELMMMEGFWDGY